MNPKMGLINLVCILALTCFDQTKSNCVTELSKDPKNLHVQQVEESCFYIISGATTAAHIQDQDKFKFDGGKARFTCMGTGLPILDNPTKIDKFNEYMKDALAKNVDGLKPDSILGAMLGLKADNNEWSWDDGNKLTDASRLENPSDTGTTVIMKHADGKWHKLADGAANAQMIAVICEAKQKSPNGSPSKPKGQIMVCDQRFDNSQNLIERKKWVSPRCYFTIKGAVEEANANQTEGYVFNKDKAREICARYHATLPFIDDHSASKGLEHLLKEYSEDDLQNFHGVALGITQTISAPSIINEWDNTTYTQHLSYGYQHPWRNKFIDAIFTIYNHTSPEKEWVSEPKKDFKGTQKPVLVVCEQRSGSIPMKPLSPRASRCLMKLPEIDKAEIFDNKHCYFMKTGSDLENVIEHRPNEWCVLSDGQVPKIHSKKEAEFIKKHFFDYMTTGTADKRLFIPLSLYQVSGVNDYWFEPNVKADFSHGINFPTKDQYAFMTVLNINKDGYQFDNIDSFSAAANAKASFMYLCEQENVEIVSQCHNESTDGEILMDSCYFAVKGAAELVNTKGADGKYLFDYDKAKQICKDHNAELTSVGCHHTSQLLMTLLERLSNKSTNTNNTVNLALGLIQEIKGKDAVEYKWEYPNAKFSYESPWENKFNFTESNYTMMVIRGLGEEQPRVHWVNVAEKTTHEEPVHVICQQIHRGPMPPNQTEMVDPCNDLPAGVNAIPIDTTCYFSPIEADINVVTQDGFYFDVEEARTICKQHGAHLPMVWQESVLGQLQTFFKEPMETKLDSKNVHFAIGLKQESNPLDYRWDDGTKLDHSFINWNWSGKESYAYFTAVPLFNEITYVNFPNDHSMQKIGIICQVPHTPKPTTSTEQPPEPESTEPTPTEAMTTSPNVTTGLNEPNLQEKTNDGVSGPPSTVGMPIIIFVAMVVKMSCGMIAG